MTDAPAVCRDDPLHVLPWDLPREFRRYDTPVTILGAGQPGKRGLMELTFALRDGVSRAVHRYQRAPLQMLRPIYYDPARPDMPFVILIQAGGGMLQGDRYRLDITCQEGAAAHVTTQSAGKLYKCEENFVTQVITISAEAGSFVEYLPDPTIPYRHARFYQRTMLRIDPDATVIVGEILTAGRIAYGERHDYDIVFSQLDAHDPTGKLLASDTIKLEPASGPPGGPALFGPYDAFGVLYVFSRRLAPADLVGLLRGALASDGRVAERTIGGVSELPNGCGASVRILGATGAAVERARDVAWNAARIALTGAPAPDRRKA